MMIVKRVSGQAELVQVFRVRIRVFVGEQRVPAAIELDVDDQQALHFLALISGKAVGTARVVIKHGAAKIGRMAVLKSYRHKGVGAALLKRAVGAARRLLARRIYLHAQVAVRGFYERMGFQTVGPVFLEAGIRHRKMILPRHASAKHAGSRVSITRKALKLEPSAQ